ncbi:MAG TPA: response regulator [Gaiellaceae bacterium]|nr:response regulator [Gaiellaceae bacterium]
MPRTDVSAEPPKVLIVDDDPSLRLLCRVNLELEGYRVVEARNVAEAEEAFTSGDVELVLLDIHIGADDGVELMRSLRKRGLPAAVVLFTGSAQLDRDTRAEADGVVPKPFQLDELLGVVRTLIGRAPAG